MATVNAITALAEAIRHIFDSTMAAERADLGLDNIEPNFAVANAQGIFRPSVTTGGTILVYRVLPNLTHRTPAGRLLPTGRRQRSRLPVDVHLLVTAWASDAGMQYRLLAWMMRTLEDYPTLPPNLLNFSTPRTFGADEAVELAISELTLDETLSLWEHLTTGEQPYQVSVPYVARSIYIESRREAPTGDLVQTRQFDMAVIEDET
jgi:hypothetical protein